MSGRLNHSPAHILTQLLIDYGVATRAEDEQAWPVYHSHMQDEPDNAFCLYHTAGRQFGRIQITGDVQEHYGIQLRVRSVGVVLGYKKAREVLNLWDRVVKRDVVRLQNIDDAGQPTGTYSEYIVHGIHRTSDVLPLGTEPTSRRRLWTLNAVASITMTDEDVDIETGTGTGTS